MIEKPKLTERDLLEKFTIFNHQYFGNELPTPRFKVINNLKNVGFFSCLVDKRGNIDKPLIEISGSFHLTNYQLRRVMVHEMIHYYLAYKGIDCDLTHGDAFMKMAEDFNSRYGIGVEDVSLESDFVKRGDTKKRGFFGWFR